VTLDEVQDLIAGHLDEIQTYFKEPKVTILVRTLDQEDGDLCMSNDEFEDIVFAIRRLQARDIREKT